jgi:hypothetical protein
VTGASRWPDTTRALLDIDTLILPPRVIAFSQALFDVDGRKIGRAVNGTVRDADGTLVVRPRPHWEVAAGDGSLVGTMRSVRPPKVRGKRPRLPPSLRFRQIRFEGSEEVAAEVVDGVVHLTGSGRHAVATIIPVRRGISGQTWQLTFSACDDRRLRLMCLKLLGELAARGGA